MHKKPQSAVIASPKAIPPAKVLLLSENDARCFHEYLDTVEGMPYPLSESVLSGALGIRSNLLENAARIAHTFHQTCRALHARMPSDESVRKNLLRALDPLPTVQEIVTDLPFFLRYMRMDFFLEPKEGKLWITEVNSGGGGLTDYLRCTRWLKNHYDFSPPKGFLPLEVEDMLHCLSGYVLEQLPHVKTLGLVAVENGYTDCLPEYLEYAQWLQKNTKITPVLLELTKGTLGLYTHPDVPSVINDLSELDAIIVDWFEDLPCLEKTEKQLRQNDVALVPPRSDLLFENKHTLSYLQTIACPQGVDEVDWDLLQSALLPSFPFEELESRKDEVRHWPGFVLKMDLDCGSENVHIFDFSRCAFGDAIQKAKHFVIKDTWTIQRFIQPPLLPLIQATPEWIGYDYESLQYDLMTYFCYNEGKPHILFGSRQFSTEKVDDHSKEGRDDNIFGVVCALPM